MNALLKEVFEVLHQNEIAYCVLRDGAELPNVDLHNAEIDLLVDARQFLDFDSRMRALGFRPFSRWGYEPHTHYVKSIYDNASSFELDVVTEISFGVGLRDLKTDLADNCLKNRRLVGGIYLPSVEDELFVVLLHCVLDKNRVAPHRAARIQTLREQVTETKYLSQLCARYWSATISWTDLDALIVAGMWSNLLAQREAVASHITKQDVIGSWTRAVGKRTLRKVDRVVRMTRRNLPSKA